MPARVGAFRSLLAASAARTGLVIEGDSQSVNQSGKWSYRWAANHPAVATTLVAQNSRTVGGPAWAGPPIEGVDSGSPAGNTMLAHSADDLALNTAALVTMIGDNDFNTFSLANTLSKLAAWAGPIRAAGVKVILVTPPPHDSRHASYATYNPRRLTYLSQIRTDWATYVDALVPFGDHPDINTATDPNPWLGDGVHLTDYDPVGFTGGQNRLYECVDAALSSYFDASRADATSPYAGQWFGADPTVAASEVVTRRYIVSGLGLGVVATFSVSGSGTIRRGFGSFGTSSFTVMNGDVIELQVTASATSGGTASATVTIGALSDILTLNTVVDVPAIVDTYGGALTSAASGTSQSWSNVAFAAGLPVLVLNSYSGAGGATDSGPTSITLTPSGGGGAISLSKVGEQMRGTAASRVVETWAGTADVAAGNYTVAITRPAAAIGTFVEYLTLANADPTPVSYAGNTPVESSVTSHSTPSATVPSKGIALAGYLIEDTTSPTAVTVSAGTLLHQGTAAITGATTGVALAKRTGTGVVTFVHITGTIARSIAVWKALGT